MPTSIMMVHLKAFITEDSEIGEVNLSCIHTKTDAAITSVFVIAYEAEFNNCG